jgi:hypothetical protein
MKNNQTDICSDGHVWVCKEESGFLGEIETFRYLTSVEINNLNSSKNIDTICSKGVIICTHCGQIACENEKETNKFLRNIKNIKI